MSYGFSKKVDVSFEEAIKNVTEALKEKGFGILTEIDVKETFKNKLDIDFKPYKILGACNPSFAYKSLQQEEQIGLMLPCNIIVYINDNDETIVAAVDPIASMKAVENEKLGEIAKTVQEMLESIIQHL
ncbi:MAG: DUF302 domain-containing protein [Melioribacteraceae bacterium]|nr:DUF302 domain-containing protein [Melioribacteraceae bacterium]